MGDSMGDVDGIVTSTSEYWVIVESVVRDRVH